MGTTKDLAGKEAIEKIKELAEGIDICMFCTEVESLPFSTRPMSTQEVDEQGNIWFLSSAKSDKNLEIKQNDKVQLIYSKASDAHFLSVYGHADVLRDKQKLDEVWTTMAKAWFTEGKEDPDITLIRVRPEQAHYWDTKHGKVVSLLKIATAVVTGNTMDDGVQGEAKI
jgi:general stress protein 26